MRILFVGDIFGRAGRDLIRRGLPAVVHSFAIDLTVANVENIAAGSGVTRELGDDMLRRGVDAMTTGNHVWDRREALSYVGAEPRLLRPLNMSPDAPGRGVTVVRTASGQPVGIINAIGRVFMNPADDPFRAVSAAVETLASQCRVILVDFHAEASAEKMAMGWHLNGRVSAVVGTHTHVQTADNRILPGGTAYITDAGMTGPHDSIIGVTCESALTRFLTGLPQRMEPAEGNPRLQAVVITVDHETGRATAIERIDWSMPDIRAAQIAAGSDLDDE